MEPGRPADRRALLRARRAPRGDGGRGRCALPGLHRTGEPRQNRLLPRPRYGLRCLRRRHGTVRPNLAAHAEPGLCRRLGLGPRHRRTARQDDEERCPSRGAFARPFGIGERRGHARLLGHLQHPAVPHLPEGPLRREPAGDAGRHDALLHRPPRQDVGHGLSGELTEGRYQWVPPHDRDPDSETLLAGVRSRGQHEALVRPQAGRLRGVWEQDPVPAYGDQGLRRLLQHADAGQGGDRPELPEQGVPRLVGPALRGLRRLRTRVSQAEPDPEMELHHPHAQGERPASARFPP